MELQNSREYKAAQELERALNDMGWSPKRFAERIIDSGVLDDIYLPFI